MTIKIVDENENATISLQTTALANVIVFDPAIKEIVSAMRHGAFQRFLQVQSNNELWVAFLYSRQAHGMYQNMSGGRATAGNARTTNPAATGLTAPRPSRRTAAARSRTRRKPTPMRPAGTPKPVPLSSTNYNKRKLTRREYATYTCLGRCTSGCRARGVFGGPQSPPVRPRGGNG